MLRRILYFALIICVGLLLLAIIDIRTKRDEPPVPRKLPMSQEWRVL